ncbi:MAG: hypothetical protein QW478_11420 [Candidatus Micrarchaeaceae archaeon]
MAKKKYIKEVKKDVNIINDYPVFSTTGGTTITIYEYFLNKGYNIIQI